MSTSRDQQLQTINLSSVATWRKTGSLPRHLRQWKAARSRVMSEEEMGALDELEEAHGRKTRLAMASACSTARAKGLAAARS
jgi:hypothetical protein